ncbi:hypothetical protein N7481_001564 [Penicillium waksmanii]|uniref:uncharacterized protein n=1 Tax=Penicillium waksmanii TaxID=69791 RepID=UPI002547A09D|nr:uncharacterized protein N7481_001564 [Penicillium waksmanii]KAJ6001155.1 hypothetical protein N7481_001564 [Penicillium waksmanii]
MFNKMPESKAKADICPESNSIKEQQSSEAEKQSRRRYDMKNETNQTINGITGPHSSKIANKLDPRVDSNEGTTTGHRDSKNRMPGWMVA